MEKKTLTCKYPNGWEGYEVIELAINEIWRSVPIVDKLGGIPFRQRLAHDLQADGMHFPIMVVNTTHLELERAKEKWGKKLSELPFWYNELSKHKKYQWSVWGGSQRVDIAKYLGYTHIHAAVLPNIAKAISLQKIMRKPFTKRYYNEHAS